MSTTPSSLNLPWRLRMELIASSVAINTLMLAMPVATLQIYDRVLPRPGGGTLVMLAVGVAGAILLEMALRLARARVTNAIGRQYERRHSAQLVAHALGSWVLPARQCESGEYVQAMGAIARMKDYAVQRLIALSVDVPYVVLFLALLGVIGGPLALVPLVAMVAFALLVVHWGLRLRRAIAERNAADEQRYGFMLETLAGAHAIKALGLEPRFTHRFQHLQWQAGRSGLAIAWINHTMAAMAAIFSQMMVVAVVAVGAPLVIENQLSMGALIACVLLSGRLVQPLQHALVCWMGYQEFEQARQQVMRITALPLQPMREQEEAAIRGRVVWSGLGFRYRPEMPMVVQGVQLEVQPGEAVGICGPAGAGRTTLLKLLAGLLDPTEGDVRVDSMNPAHWLPQQLVRHVAYLGAEPVLLRGTIMQNLTCFDNAMQARAHELAQFIGLDGLVAQLPHGYETMLEGGQSETIPPGVRQRVAMVCALLHKPRLILYDQADRSLDREGYHQLYRLFARLKGKATLLLVSDDQNMLRLCDRVLVMEDGVLAPRMGAPGAPHLRLVETVGAR
jgi:ATP-binding cassette subfamily C protein LapB